MSIYLPFKGKNMVAISKVTSRDYLKILIIDEDGENTNKISNIY
jgi:hypothetical protein